MDVAQAMSNINDIPSLPGTLNLPGPSEMSYEYLLNLVSHVTYRPPSSAPVVPKRIATLLAKTAQNVWWPALSPDEVERRFISDVQVPGDWDKVGIQPSEIEDHAITYLRRYRSAYVQTFPSFPLFLKKSQFLPSLFLHIPSLPFSLPGFFLYYLLSKLRSLHYWLNLSRLTPPFLCPLFQ